MKRWIETRLVEPPTFVVSGRFGGSVMFVGYEKWSKEWLWIQPGGIRQKIAEPTHIFVDEAWIEDHLLASPRPTKSSGKIHRQKEEQLFLI
jgi:hypothetical protein